MGLCCKTYVWEHTTHVAKTTMVVIHRQLDTHGGPTPAEFRSPCSDKKNYRIGLGHRSLEKWTIGNKYNFLSKSGHC